MFMHRLKIHVVNLYRNVSDHGHVKRKRAQKIHWLQIEISFTVASEMLHFV